MADATVPPLARAIRLGSEIRRLREQQGVSQDALAKSLGVARSVVSRMESPTGEPHRRSDPRHVRAALRALVKEGSKRYRALEPLMWDATDHGWWETQRGMGKGQRIVAEVECGAALIRAYQMALIPGLAQTEAYARCRAAASVDDIDAVVAGRMRRQEAAAATGTRCEFIIEDLALRRPLAPPEVMVEQFHHLVALADRPDMSVRVLPPAARLDVGWAPTSPFSIYEYPDHDDPSIVLLDVVGRLPDPMAEPGDVNVYVQLYERLASAALSGEDSVALIKDAADRIGC